MWPVVSHLQVPMLTAFISLCILNMSILFKKGNHWLVKEKKKEEKTTQPQQGWNPRERNKVERNMNFAFCMDTCLSTIFRQSYFNSS